MSTPDYSFQERGIELAMQMAADPLGPPPHRLLLAAPTGSGKSRIASGIQMRLASAGVRCGVFSSRVDILLSIAKQMPEGPVDPEISEAKQIAALEARDMWTPQRFLNALAAGRVQAYDVVVLDEGHHAIAETWNEVLGTASKAIALTATPYRGTPRGTAELYEEWGRPVWLVTLRETVARGITSMPQFHVCPLVDDDLAEVSKGEFTEKSLDQLISPKVEAILDQALERHRDGAATVVCMPSRALAAQTEKSLRERGIACAAVTGETPLKDRAPLYKACEKGSLWLIVVGVLAEGVDLRLDEMHCARPMRSPVQAMQLWGRMTRPHLSPVIYDYTRNVERFAYLWDGLLPVDAIIEAQAGFGGASKRAAARAIDIEGVARLKRLEIPLAKGLWAEGYMLQRTGVAGITEQYCVVYAPWLETPLVAKREHNRAEWVKASIPVGLDGYNTLTARFPMSIKQEKWWKRAAHTVGLDRDAKVDMRTFAFLPALVQSGQHLRRRG